VSYSLQGQYAMSFIFSYRVRRNKHDLVAGVYDPSIHPRDFAMQFTGPKAIESFIAAGKAARLVGGLHVHCNSQSLSIGALYNGSMRIFRAVNPSPILVTLLEAHTFPAARMILSSYIRHHPDKKHYFEKSIQEDSRIIPEDMFADELKLLDLQLVQKCPHLEIYANLYYEVPRHGVVHPTRDASPVRRRRSIHQ